MLMPYGLPQPLDQHTRRALEAAADDLATAAKRVTERALDRCDGSALDQVLIIFDTLDNARRALARL